MRLNSMPRAEMRVKSQASHGNITVLSHLKNFSVQFYERCFMRYELWVNVPGTIFFVTEDY